CCCVGGCQTRPTALPASRRRSARCVRPFRKDEPRGFGGPYSTCRGRRNQRFRLDARCRVARQTDGQCLRSDQSGSHWPVRATRIGCAGRSSVLAMQLPSLEPMPVWSRLHEASYFSHGGGARTKNPWKCKESTGGGQLPFSALIEPRKRFLRRSVWARDSIQRRIGSEWTATNMD